MTTKPRPMTPEDYAEAGIPVPEHMRDPEAPRARDWQLSDLVGLYFTATVHKHGGYTDERCDECGDETGECGCE